MWNLLLFGHYPYHLWHYPCFLIPIGRSWPTLVFSFSLSINWLFFPSSSIPLSHPLCAHIGSLITPVTVGKPTLPPSKAERELAVPAIHVALVVCVPWLREGLHLRPDLHFPLQSICSILALNRLPFATADSLGKNSWIKMWPYVLDGHSREGCWNEDSFLFVVRLLINI